MVCTLNHGLLSERWRGGRRKICVLDTSFLRHKFACRGVIESSPLSLNNACFMSSGLLDCKGCHDNSPLRAQ